MSTRATWRHVILAALGQRGAVARLLADTTPSLDEPAPLELPADLLAASAETPIVDLAAALHKQGVTMLLRGAPGYPPALLRTLGGEQAPPVLFVQGEPARLADPTPAVGFCGSRHASPRALSVAAACAERLAAQGVNVVSGHAAGVDEAVHTAALRAGLTTLVLPEGILRFRLRGALAPLARPDNLVVVSSFPPRLPWSVGNAMARNHLICGLSGALIVIEAGDTGGTLAAGRAALAHGVPLFVVDFAPPAAPGNALLLAAGGVPLRRRPSGEPNLDAVLAAARALSPRDGAQIR